MSEKQDKYRITVIEGPLFRQGITQRKAMSFIGDIVRKRMKDEDFMKNFNF